MAELTKSEKRNAYVVTTAHRGVFFGYSNLTAKQLMATKHPEIGNARMCVYWPRDVHGVMGLASVGPLEGSRVGPSSDVVLKDVTAVLSATDVAVKRWESEPWS